MILDIKSAYVSILLAVVIICGVYSYPQPGNNNAENNKVHVTINKSNKAQKLSKLKYNNQIISKVIARNEEKKNYDDVVVGSMEVNNEYIAANINLPSDKNIQGNNDNPSADNNQNNGDVITGSMEINDENAQGHIDVPVADNNQNNGDVITGSMDINDENIQGHIDFPDADNNKNIGDVITGSMEINDENAQGHINIPDADNNQKNGDVITGSMEINDENIQGHIDIPDADDNKNNGDIITGSMEINTENIQGQINIPDVDNNQNNGDVITGSIENNDENVQGNINIPDSYNNQKNGDVITGSMEINDENIQGHIDIPDADDNKNNSDVITGSMEINDENAQGHISIPDADNNQNNGDVITGSMEINGKNIQGHIDIPDANNNPNNGEIITGSMEIDTENIQGHIDIPDADNNPNNGDIITGSMEINTENIQGHINIPDTDNNQNNSDVIIGSMEINDENIQGHIDIPDADNNKNNSDVITGSMEINTENIQGQINIPDVDNNQNNGDVITGSMEINDENIQGHINIPDVDNKQNNGDVITGSMEINDENIQGHINIPDVDNKQNNGDVITGSMEINDENIQGHINIPDVDNKQNNGDAITGSMQINDENIQGQLDIPGDVENKPSDGNIKTDKTAPVYRPGALKLKNCWMSLNCDDHYKTLDELDEAYSKARQTYQKDVGDDFSAKMLDVLLVAQGAAPRAIHQAGGDPKKIPSGINLGGYCMMRMRESLLFFHRMKLRNNTQFTVNYLQTNLADMTLTVRLSLNDIHLQGAYERCITGLEPFIMLYIPNFGEMEVLLKSVNYKMEGRLRLLNDRLIIEVVNSDVLCKKIIMTYLNNTFHERTTYLQPRNIEAFLDRMKADLDLWLKDYFNDYLMYFGIVGGGNSQLLEYEKKKTIRVNQYADDAITSIKARLRQLKMAKVKLPHFTIISIKKTHIALTNGKLTGLDSIYRRSVATTKKENKMRMIDMIIGFSSLKVEYNYEAQIAGGMPHLTGKLILTADELAAHLAITHVVQPEAVDLSIDSITQIKPESLTVEGPANRLIANFKAMLEHPILALMSNALRHNIVMLKTLTRCEPTNVSNDDEKKSRDDTDSGDTNNKINKGSDDDGFFGSPNEYEHGNKKWADYVMSKNDSVEIEVPVDGKVQTMKLKRTEKFVLSKVDEK